MADYAAAQLSTRGVNASSYTHHVLVLPPSMPCTFIGYSNLACGATRVPCRAWVHARFWNQVGAWARGGWAAWHWWCIAGSKQGQAWSPGGNHCCCCCFRRCPTTFTSLDTRWACITRWQVGAGDQHVAGAAGWPVPWHDQHVGGAAGWPGHDHHALWCGWVPAGQSEYADLSSAMGSCCLPRCYNAVQNWQLGGLLVTGWA
jgi:hypothetical protein